MKQQLEKEDKLTGISNDELRNRVHERLMYFTGFTEVNKDHIDKVIFMSNPEQNTTTDEDKSVCSQSDVERDANSNIEFTQQTDSNDDWDEEKDIMAFIDE